MFLFPSLALSASNSLQTPQILLVTIPSFFKLKIELVFYGLDVMGRKKNNYVGIVFLYIKMPGILEGRDNIGMYDIGHA